MHWIPFPTNYFKKFKLFDPNREVSQKTSNCFIFENQLKRSIQKAENERRGISRRAPKFLCVQAPFPFPPFGTRVFIKKKRSKTGYHQQLHVSYRAHNEELSCCTHKPYVAARRALWLVQRRVSEQEMNGHTYYVLISPYHCHPFICHRSQSAVAQPVCTYNAARARRYDECDLHFAPRCT